MCAFQRSQLPKINECLFCWLIFQKTVVLLAVALFDLVFWPILSHTFLNFTQIAMYNTGFVQFKKLREC